MSEYNDDKKWKDALDRAKRDPSVNPNVRFQLERQIRKNEKQKLAKLHREMTTKQLKEKQNKLKDEMSRKGIQNADTKPDARQFIDDAKRKEDADRAQGQTEKPAQTA